LDAEASLRPWVDTPETVERKVWPEALKLAEKGLYLIHCFAGCVQSLEVIM